MLGKYCNKRIEKPSSQGNKEKHHSSFILMAHFYALLILFLIILRYFLLVDQRSLKMQFRRQPSRINVQSELYGKLIFFIMWIKRIMNSTTPSKLWMLINWLNITSNWVKIDHWFNTWRIQYLAEIVKAGSNFWYQMTVDIKKARFKNTNVKIGSRKVITTVEQATANCIKVSLDTAPGIVSIFINWYDSIVGGWSE